MNKIYCRLKPSLIENAGVGVFAIDAIPFGVDPFPGSETNITIMSNDAYNLLSEEKQKMIRDFCYNHHGNWRVPDFNKIDISWYVNSSENPNLSFDSETGNYTTLREIKVGEELTYDYLIYD